jgi:hypothetical protein
MYWSSETINIAKAISASVAALRFNSVVLQEWLDLNQVARS